MTRVARDSYAEPVDAPHVEIGPMPIRDILADMGVPPPLATMATPALFFTPGESDPASQNTMVIVQGVQKCLVRMGYQLKRNGLMDAGTQNAIAEVAGRNWAAMPWNYIYTLCRMAGAQRARPKSQVNWKQEQPTAIGEALGEVLTPTDALIPYTLPSTAIECVGSGSSEYCYGKTSAVTTAFKQLQGVLGVTTDGKIGPVTASNAASKARTLWYQRAELKMPVVDSDHLAQVYQAWEKYRRPFVVAASANKTASLISKYRAHVYTTPKPATSPVAAPGPTTVESLTPDLTMGGFGTGTLAIVGLAALAGLYFFTGKKSQKPQRNRRRR
jgi:hypothetical protein